MVFISTDTPPPQICSGFMELCQAMFHLDPSGTSLSWADHLSKHVETCRISIPHLHFICIISHISTDSKKKGRSCLERTMNTTSPDLIPELPPRLIAASTDTDVKLEARVSTTKTRANNPTNQTCACKGTSRAQE